MANSVDPDQTAIGAVCSASTLFASILNLSIMLGNYLQQTTSADDIFRCIFLGALRANLVLTIRRSKMGFYVPVWQELLCLSPENGGTYWLWSRSVCLDVGTALWKPLALSSSVIEELPKFLLSDSSPFTKEGHSKCIQLRSAACYRYVTEHENVVACDIVVYTAEDYIIRVRAR